MADPLEGLDAVPWSELEHAYGSAEDVPEQLRALAGPDPQERGRAQWALYGNLWHQGIVYSASPHAVPFLLRLLEAASYADRAWVLGYLYELAGGTSYLDAHKDLTFYDGQRETPEFKAQLEAELRAVAATRAAVSEGRAIFERLLSEPAIGVAAAAARLLARVNGEGLDADAQEALYNAIEAAEGRLDDEGDREGRLALTRAQAWLDGQLEGEAP